MNLEYSFEEESKQKNRMTQQVEELQWRIKNKMELPPPKVVSVATAANRMTTRAVVERPNTLITDTNGFGSNGSNDNVDFR